MTKPGKKKSGKRKEPKVVIGANHLAALMGTLNGLLTFSIMPPRDGVTKPYEPFGGVAFCRVDLLAQVEFQAVELLKTVPEETHGGLMSLIQLATNHTYERLGHVVDPVNTPPKKEEPQDEPTSKDG